MSVDDLTEILNSSKLLPYEIAEAVKTHLEPIIVTYIEFSSIDHLHNNIDLVAFYLAAKRLAE